MINTVKKYDALSKQYDKMLEERNSLIDDIDWQQKKIERLEWTIKNKDDEKDWLEHENKELKQWHQTHKECADAVYEQKVKLERENEALREQNYKYCKLGNHIRLKAKMNPGVSRYIDLVNYIDRLERD